MTYCLNKVVGAFLNPLGIGILLILLSVALSVVGRKRRPCVRPFAVASAVLAVAWLWFWSCGIAGRLVGLPLERAFPPRPAEEMPQADAIVVLGGGTSLNTNACPFVKLFASADRVWQGARLFRAGKASRIFVTFESDARFLADLGVPRSAITVSEKARNTEEEARWLGANVRSAVRPKILLVTSAWHMRRALLMYARYAKDVDVIPAASDYMNLTTLGHPVSFADFVPDAMTFAQNAYMFKEWIGYAGYRWLRK